MHEGNFTQQIVDSILQELEKHPNTRPRHIKVKVGDMFHLNSESVKSHFESIAKGTPLEGATLELEEVQLTAKCNRCGWNGEVEDHHLLVCGACASREVEVLGGDEVVIETIDLEQ